MKKIFTFLVAFLATLSGAVWGQNVSSGDVNITTAGSYTITGTTENHSISVSGGGVVDITLDNVSVDLSEDNGAAFTITENTTVNLTLTGENKMISGYDYAGIYVETGSTLIITKESTGSIDAACVSEDEHPSHIGKHANGAGIGGSNDNPNFGTIRIEGGTISARCHTDRDAAHANAAGLGGGNGSETGVIIITGGTVTAKCSDNVRGIDLNQQAVGAAIGGGYAGSCSSITILGGNITASVEAGGQKGFTIGVGHDNKKAEPSIIWGDWDESTTPTITENGNDNWGANKMTNFLDVRDGTLTMQKGTVTMPVNTQMVLKTDPTSTLNAYKVVYNSNLPGITPAGGKMPTTMAYGPSTPYTLATVEDLTATVNSYPYQVVSSHWLNNNNAWVAAGQEETTSASVASGLSTILYGAAWVLKEASLEFNDDEGLSVPLNVYGPEGASFDITATDNETYSSLEEVGLQISERQLKKADPYSAVTPDAYSIQLNFTPKDQTTTALQGIVKVNVKDTPDDASSLVISAATTEGNVLTYNGTVLNKGTDGKYINDKAIAIKKADGTTVSTSLFDVEYSLTGTDGSWSKDLKNAGKYYVKITPATSAYENSKTTTEAIVEVKKADVTVTFVGTATYDMNNNTSDVSDYSDTEIEFSGIIESEKEIILKLLSWTGTVDPDAALTAGTYEDAVTYTIKVAEENAEAADNYNLPTDAKGDLKVIKTGDADDPINPGNPEDGDTEIKIDGDDWEWDATLNGNQGGYKKVYDGETYTLDKDNLVYVRQKGGENEWIAVPASAIEVTSVSPEGDIKNQGTYTVKLSITETKDILYTGTVGDITLVIEERPLGIYFDLTGLGEEYIGRQNIPASEFVDYREVPGEAISGLVEGEIPAKIEGTISIASEPNANGKYAVTFANIAPATSSTFSPLNYDEHYYLNNEEIDLSTGEGTFGDDDDESFEGIEIDDNTGSGSSIATKRYQLYLADRDFLKNDDYAAEGLELFSRHDKKYTNAGGSFTIWYEHNGEVNEGGYRIFWSNRANGDYKEVKLDEVSGYYQIRNVQSNVYVKIYAADGFPVANEEISATDARAYAQAGKIVVITPEPTDVQIISMTGAVVATDKVAGQREFANLTEGVYIVRMGSEVVKLQVRN